MIEHKSEQDQPGEDHGFSGESRYQGLLYGIIFRICGLVLQIKLDSKGDVNGKNSEHHQAHNPNQRPPVMQMLGIGVDGISAEVNRHVAQQMTSDKQDQDQSGHRHQNLSSDSTCQQIHNLSLENGKNCPSGLQLPISIYISNRLSRTKPPLLP